MTVVLPMSLNMGTRLPTCVGKHAALPAVAVAACPNSNPNPKPCLQIPGVTKLEKRLEDTAHKWDEIKKAQPQVKSDVEPIQVQKGEDIKKEIEGFASRVRNYRMDFRKRSFFKYATGFDAAYPEIDVVARELAELRKEVDRMVELASVFEFPQLVEPVMASIKETVDDLVMVKDVWDTAILCERARQARGGGGRWLQGAQAAKSMQLRDMTHEQACALCSLRVPPSLSDLTTALHARCPHSHSPRNRPPPSWWCRRGSPCAGGTGTRRAPTSRPAS